MSEHLKEMSKVGWPCPHGFPPEEYDNCKACKMLSESRLKMKLKKLVEDNLLAEICIDKQIAINGKDLFRSPDYFAKCVALRAIRAERQKEGDKKNGKN